MRDIVLSIVIALLLLKALRRAEVGAYLWAWLSLMNPHKMTYGFAYTMPFALMSAVVTLVSMLYSKSRRPLPMSGGVILLLMLWFWVTVTSIASINPADMVWERWIFVSKIYLMLLVTLMLVRERQQIDVLVWVVVGSIGFFAVKGGVFTLLTGGTFRVWGPPDSMLEENNALAVASLMIMPLIYYLRHTASKSWLRKALAVSMVLVGVSVLGSQSRGALVALLTMAFVLGLKSKQPVRFTLALALLIGLGIAFMPDSWNERMDTIKEFDADSSAMSRLYTWRTLWNAAIDRPLVGAGFRADTVELFARYAPTDSVYDVFHGRAWVAHSIYLQALGEHGFIGLALYLGIWVWVWLAASRVAKQAEALPDLRDWLPLLMRMCQVATLGFCAGGAFLSLMNLDLPFYLLAFVTLGRCAVQDRRGKAVPGVLPVPQPGRAGQGLA